MLLPEKDKAQPLGLDCDARSKTTSVRSMPASKDGGSHKGRQLGISCLLTNGCGSIRIGQVLNDIAANLSPWHCKKVLACRMIVKLRTAPCKVKLPGIKTLQVLSDDGIANVLLTNFRNFKRQAERSRNCTTERSCNSTILSVSGCFLC